MENRYGVHEESVLLKRKKAALKIPAIDQVSLFSITPEIVVLVSGFL